MFKQILDYTSEPLLSKMLVQKANVLSVRKPYTSSLNVSVLKEILVMAKSVNRE